MDTHRWIKWGLQTGLCGCMYQAVAQQAPHIIFVMADDAGYRDFGFQEFDPIYRQVTPRIDEIARDGARFTHAYVTASVCAPSRAGFLTGRYQQRFGFQQNLPSHWGDTPDSRWLTDEWKDLGLHPDLDTMGDWLQRQGYYTGIVGKWHQGYADHHAPHNRGFDFTYILRAGSRSFFSQPELEENPSELIPYRYRQLERNGEFLPEDRIHHITETFGDASIKFIDEALETGRPFFLFLSHTAPHTPMQPDAESLARAQELFPDASDRRQAYIGLMLGMDLHTGRVLDHLEHRDITDQTVVIFFNDNGGAHNNASNNLPLRDHKYSPFEGGFRVPLVMRWPGVLEPGTVIHDPVIALDFLPTFLSMAGGKLPEELDGVDLTPLLRGEVDTLGERSLYWREVNRAGLSRTILQLPWKLIERESSRWVTVDNGTPYLFRMDQDIGESENVAEAYPEVVAELRAAFAAWEAKLPEPNW